MNSETKVKQRPILFSTPMVQAEREGRKSMTRRILKPGVPIGNFEETLRHCPYGRPGDILWVREEHYRFGHWEPVPGVRTKQGRQKWAFIPDTDEVLYFDVPPAEFRKGRHHKDPATPEWHKRLARFIPKALCRTYLQITDIKVERLQDISEEDAVSEGAEPAYHRCGGFGYYEAGGEIEDCKCQNFIDNNPEVEGFKNLWESINGPESWNANPWVWAISFSRIDKPE